jgi:hypothetical protein
MQSIRTVKDTSCSVGCDITLLERWLCGIHSRQGPQYFAEKWDDSTFYKMPLNALVNLGYFFVALYWLLQRSRVVPLYSRVHRWIFDIFIVMTLVYGPIQFFRTISLNKWWIVVDQWVTLPFFALCIAWNSTRNQEQNKWIAPETTLWIVIILSILSYPLTPFIPHGYEIVLGTHILICLVGCIRTCRDCGWQWSLTSRLLLALLSCLAFLFLKLYDLELAKYWVFRRVTGHFWSKVGDFMQIFWIMDYFHVYAVLYARIHSTPTQAKQKQQQSHHSSSPKGFLQVNSKAEGKIQVLNKRLYS